LNTPFQRQTASIQHHIEDAAMAFFGVYLAIYAQFVRQKIRIFCFREHFFAIAAAFGSLKRQHQDWAGDGLPQSPFTAHFLDGFALSTLSLVN
jgi:hypothetical protein